MGANAGNIVVSSPSLVKDSENQLVEEVSCLGQPLATLRNDIVFGMLQLVQNK